MSRTLTKKQKEFADTYIATGNGKEAALAAYDTEDPNTAAVIASENLIKPNIIDYLAAALPDELLAEVHREGLFASREVWKNNNETKTIEHVSDEPDFAVRAKYLDMAYKIKGTYAPERRIIASVRRAPSEKVKNLIKKLNK